MASQIGANSTKKSKPSYFYSIMSFALVLFLIGTTALLWLQGKGLVKYLKENISITLVLNETVKEVDAKVFIKQLEEREYVKKAVYTSKDEAAESLKKEFGEDFETLLEFNPLYASVNINLNEAFADEVNIEEIKANLQAEKAVQEVYYKKDLLQTINQNVNKAALIFLVIGLIFILLSLSVLDNTIKISMYSDRFLIKNMQLVGATNGFVMKPYLKKGIINGLISSILAIILLTACGYWIYNLIPEVQDLTDFKTIGILFLLILLIGLLISFFSTYGAVRKYLKLKLEELY